MKSNSEFLKEHTKLSHKKTEILSERFHLFKGSFSKKQYSELIQFQYKWHAVISQMILESSINSGDTTDLKRLLEQLKQDVECIKEEDLQVVSETYPNQKHLLGLLYVVYGSLMGGSIIAKFLKKKQIPEAEMNYYNLCSEEGPKIFKKFQLQLNEQELSQEELIAVLESAIFAFGLAQELMEG